VRYEVKGDGLAIQVDYSDAPVPDHYYVADYFDVQLDGANILFTFGKLDTPDRSRLRNKVEILFPVGAFIAQLWASSREFHEGLRRLSQESNLAIGPSATVEHPNGIQVRTLQSNNVLMAHSVGETILDFFYISPKELWVRPRRGEEILLEPLVRVMLQPNQLVALLDRCGELVESAKSNVHPKLLVGAPMVGTHE